MWQRSLIPPRTSSKFSKYFRGKRSSFIHRQTGGWMVFPQKKIRDPVFICSNTQPQQMVATYQSGMTNATWIQTNLLDKFSSSTSFVGDMEGCGGEEGLIKGGGKNSVVAIQKGNLSLLIHKPSKTQEGPFHCFDVFGSDYGLFSTYPKNKVLNTLLIATKSHLKDKTLQAMRMLSPVSSYCLVTIVYQWLKSSIEWENVSSESFNMMMIV